MDEKDKLLIKAFIEREAKDFSPAKSDDWINEVCDKVCKDADEIKDGDYLNINSFGNAGGLIRGLKIDVMKDSDYKKRFDYEITLCTCGQLNHTVILNKING